MVHNNELKQHNSKLTAGGVVTMHGGGGMAAASFQIPCNSYTSLGLHPTPMCKTTTPQGGI